MGPPLPSVPGTQRWVGLGSWPPRSRLCKGADQGPSKKSCPVAGGVDSEHTCAGSRNKMTEPGTLPGEVRLASVWGWAGTLGAASGITKAQTEMETENQRPLAQSLRVLSSEVQRSFALLTI